MPPELFDAIIIGTGQAGPSLAERLAKAGEKVTIIERHLFGGTCVNVGCVPTKTLIANARAAHVVRTAASYGVMLECGFHVDMKKVKARKDAVVKKSSDGVANWMRKTDGVTVIEGHARFESRRSVRVNDRLLEATHLFINVGGRAMIPNIPGLAQVAYLTNSSIMDLDTVPAHLLIIGGSYIGLEFAQMYRRFGSEVTIIEVGERLIAREDDAVSDAVKTILENEGIRCILNAKDLSVAGSDTDIAVTVTSNGSTSVVHGSHLLLAVGRVPNTDDLGLAAAGVATDKHGFITVDEGLKTNVDGIWALGDVNGRGAFTHTSYNDYELIAANLLDGEHRRVGDRINAYALYTDPPLARIGLSEREVRASGRKALIGTLPMTGVGRARERGETQGYMSVLVDADNHQILGAMLLGIEADEVVHALLDLMYAKAPYTVMQRAMHIHPTVSELLPTLLGNLKPLV